MENLGLLDNYNGFTMLISQDWTDSNALQTFTDASGQSGYGVVFGKRHVYGTWSGEWTSFNISVLES